MMSSVVERSKGNVWNGVDGTLRILVLGGGGREHALVWKLGQSPRVSEIICLPGNAGIARTARCVPGNPEDPAFVTELVRREGIDLTVIGPEAPLVAGVSDALSRLGHAVFGPSQAAARLEGSKSFAKDLMARHGIPTAAYRVFDDPGEALAFVRTVAGPVVVKADGLAAGKGVVVAVSAEEAAVAVEEAMVRRAFGAAGRKVVIEEFLEGEEVSILAFSDGERVLPMVSAQDHKRAYDGDRGPNTGGMGAYSPAPVYTEALAAEVSERILLPTVRAMAAAGCAYRGVLYAGLMITERGPILLEYNCRFGDPETQVVLPRLKSDLLDAMEACARGDLRNVTLDWHDEHSVCVVMAAGGYPGAYEKGKPITGLEEAERVPGVSVFHAGTAERDGSVVTAGGRVLGVTALAPAIGTAIARAYEAAARIDFPDKHYRRDIGRRALQQ